MQARAKRERDSAKPQAEGAAFKKKEMKMSREDDFFGDYDGSSNDMDTGQEDTSEPLMDESLDETERQPVFQEPPKPASPAPRPKAKKKSTKPKPKAAKKKTSKTSRKPAAKKTKKKAPAAKKKKAGKAKRKK
jgi:hypothetical protein